MKVLTTNRMLAQAMFAVATAAMLVAVSACGSSDSDSAGGSTASAQASSAGFREAQQLAASFKAAPTSIGITQPVGKPIDKNKTVVLVGAGQGGSGTQITYKGFQDANKFLGWNVKTINPSEPTPQLMQQALTQAMQLNPDAVVISAVPTAPITQQLQQFQAKGIPVVSTTGPDPTGGLLTLQLMGSEGIGRLAKVTADQTLADMGKPGEVGMVGIQGYQIITDYSKYYADEITRLCPSCTIKQTTLTLASLGSTAGSDIVNWVRANPKMKSVFVGWDGMDANLFSAAKQASVTLPKVYSTALVPSNISALKNGDLTASTPMDTTELGWRLADALARIFTGQTESALQQDVKYEAPVIWSKANGNVPTSVPSDGSYPPVVSDYQAQYRALWAV